MTNFPRYAAIVVSFTFLLLVSKIGWACHDGSPLVLDLNGDGILTTDDNDSVHFDIDGNGEVDEVAWTFWESREGFLTLDLNGNGLVDSGRELFGDATVLPSGSLANNGFEALSVYDDVEFGGHSDGVIDRNDEVWKDLRIWVDINQDGVSQKHELHKLHQQGVVAIDLFFVSSDEIDGNGNIHRFRGSYFKRVKAANSSWSIETLDVHDVFFRIFSGHPD